MKPKKVSLNFKDNRKQYITLNYTTENRGWVYVCCKIWAIGESREYLISIHELTETAMEALQESKPVCIYDRNKLVTEFDIHPNSLFVEFLMTIEGFDRLGK